MVKYGKYHRDDIGIFLSDSVQNQRTCVGGTLHFLHSQPQAPGPWSRGILFAFLIDLLKWNQHTMTHTYLVYHLCGRHHECIFVKLSPKWFVPLDTINVFVFLLLNFDWLLLVSRNALDFCILASYGTFLLNWLISSSTFFCGDFRIVFCTGDHVLC